MGKKKRGRPKLKSSDKRSITLRIQLRADEYKTIEKQAHVCGLSVIEFSRRQLLGDA